MAVVQAQPVFGSPYEPGREAMRAIEFGQGLRARQDALQRQTAEYNREQQVRELLGSGRPEEAKKLMTLQERGQLVAMQGNLLQQQKTQLELDVKEKVLNSVSGGLSNLSRLSTDDSEFESKQAGALIELAPLIALDPDIARSAQMIAETQTAEHKRKKEKTPGTLEFYKKQTDMNLSQVQGWDSQQLVQFKAKSDEALARLWQINSMNIPMTEKLDEFQKWDTEFRDVMRGPTGITLQNAKAKLTDQLIDIERVSKTKAGDKTEFERTIDEAVANNWLTPEQAIEEKKKRLSVFTTPRGTGNEYLEALKVLGLDNAAPTAGTPAQKVTREQLLDAVRTGQLSKEDAKRIAKEQGIQ